MKCATTWMAECLRRHPEAFVSTPKEVHFFTRDYYKGFDWYLQHFKEADNSKAVGEYTVSYLCDENAAKRILESLGDVRILISLRDPVDRFWSAYRHYLRDGRLTGISDLPAPDGPFIHPKAA